MEDTLQGLSLQQPRVVSPVPEASPTHPGWTLCSASPGGVRAGGGAATSKEAHSEGSGRAGRRKESPDCWAAAGCCGPPAQSVPPDLAPPAPRRSSLPFHSASLLPPPLRALETSLQKPITAYCGAKASVEAGRGKGRDRQPRPLPALLCKGGSGASPSLAREGPFPIHFFSGRRGSSAPHKTFTTALYKATRRLRLQNPPLGICSKCASFSSWFQELIWNQPLHLAGNLSTNRSWAASTPRPPLPPTLCMCFSLLERTPKPTIELLSLLLTNNTLKLINY